MLSIWPCIKVRLPTSRRVAFMIHGVCAQRAVDPPNVTLPAVLRISTNVSVAKSRLITYHQQGRTADYSFRTQWRQRSPRVRLEGS
jgi:hypothetical protein